MKKIIIFFLLFFATLITIRAEIVTEKMENSVGAQISRELEEQYKTTQDSRVTALGERIVRVCNRQNLNYRFKVIESPEVNALSIGGGYVYVNRGLLDVVKADDDELAFVLAHEIAHITQKHMARTMEKNMVGGVLLTVLLAVTKASEGTYNTVSVGWDVLLRGYSRTYEFEADRVGLLYLIKAGYDPQGALRMFQLLKKGEKNLGVFVVLATHPPTDKRIEQLKNTYAQDLESARMLSEMEFLSPPGFSEEK